ncbi:COBL-like 1, isoform CRA_d [Homo sapiens]
MDGRTPRPQDAPARRKPKAKAPLPPAETKYTDVSSAADSVESTAFIMEQKENMIDKDVELSVVLPGDIIKSTTVHGRYAGVNEISGPPLLIPPLKVSVIYVLMFVL